MFRNGCLDGLLAGDVGAVGRPIEVQVALFAGIGGVMPVERQFPLGVQCRLGPLLDAVPHHIHVGSFPVGKRLVHIGQRGRRRQQRGGPALGQIQFLHCHQNILTDNVLIGMVQNFFRRLAFQPVPELVLLGGHLFIEGRIFVCVHVIAPPVHGVWVSFRGYAAAPGVSALPAPRDGCS